MTYLLETSLSDLLIFWIEISDYLIPTWVVDIVVCFWQNAI